MGKRAGTNATGGGSHQCRDCGSPIRPGIQFCTDCGFRVEAAVGWQPPGPDRGVRHSRRLRPLPVVTGAIVAAGLAVGIILIAHLLGHPKLAAASSATTPRDTPSAPSATTPRDTPLAPSAGAPSADPTASAPSAVAEPQAAGNLAALLSQSGSERLAVNAAYNDAGQCGPSLSQDAETFQAAATSRRQLLSELARLPGLAVLSTAMTQDLTSAWQSSASADSDFAQWVQDELANGCSTDSQSDPSYAAADAPDLQATKSKTAFVQLWNPLAQSYGLPTYAQGDL